MPSRTIHWFHAVGELIPESLRNLGVTPEKPVVRLRQERGRGSLDAEQKVAQSVACMKQHLDQPLRIGTLAARANLSPSRFTEVFRKQTGSSPHQYLNRLRVDQGCQFLDSTNLGLKEIGASRRSCLNDGCRLPLERNNTSHTLFVRHFG